MRDPISEQRLALVHPELARRVRAAADQLEATGTFFRVGVGLRTYDESNALYAQGRTAPGHIVTNARAGYSQHNHGFAVDCYPFLVGCTGAINYDGTTPQFRAMVAALKAQGLVWGGDWKSIVDPPHFQLASIPVTPTAADRACFAQGGCAAVWAQYANTITSLKASAQLHWYQLLLGLVAGAAQSTGRWLMDHFGHPVLTGFRRAWDNSSAAPQRTTPGDTMDIKQEQQHQAEAGNVTDLQANAFTDGLKSIGKGIAKAFGANVTPDQTKAASAAVVAFVGKDGLDLAVSAVKLLETKMPGAAGIEKRDAAVADFKEKAAAAGKDLAHLASLAFNFVIEGALQVAVSEGLKAVAKVALNASAEEPTSTEA